MGNSFAAHGSISVFLDHHELSLTEDEMG